jgi:hypothetical protein
VTGDLIGTDRPAPRRRRRFVIATVAVLAAGTFAADGAAGRHERTSLRACVATAEEDVADLLKRAAGVEVYVSPQLRSPTVPASVRASLARLVEQSVERDLPRSRRDRRRCAQLTVFGWHHDAAGGREAYVSYLDLRLRQLSAATRDLTALHDRPADVAAARARAVSALAKAEVLLTPVPSP